MSDTRLLADLNRALNHGIAVSGLFAKNVKPKRRRESKPKITPPVVGQKQLF
jgi:hypothetical protein